ncbi:hypothetical protein TNCV_902781 [Trichonephila clavipes]|nr:hypothetical protein TNCV_902781 [Trichonephila clavipes]
MLFRPTFEEEQAMVSAEDFKKIFNSGSNCIIAGDYNAAHVSWHNAKSTRFGQALHRLIRDLRGANWVAPQTATHLQSRQRFEVVIDLAVFKHIPFNHSVELLTISALITTP